MKDSKFPEENEKPQAVESGAQRLKRVIDHDPERFINFVNTGPVKPVYQKKNPPQNK